MLAAMEVGEKEEYGAILDMASNISAKFLLSLTSLPRPPMSVPNRILSNSGVWRRHCSALFMKHVLPKFFSPTNSTEVVQAPVMAGASLPLLILISPSPASETTTSTSSATFASFLLLSLASLFVRPRRKSRELDSDATKEDAEETPDDFAGDFSISSRSREGEGGREVEEETPFASLSTAEGLDGDLSVLLSFFIVFVGVRLSAPSPSVDAVAVRMVNPSERSELRGLPTKTLDWAAEIKRAAATKSEGRRPGRV
mmetsp:Transcript_482/g.680  ORF Transcript_482/g.680 Transcript_482/m.680 type:complete len:256 (+) Transcript_482:932-1699(+)